MLLIRAVSANPGAVKSIGVVRSTTSFPPVSVGTPAMLPGSDGGDQSRRLLELPRLAAVEAAREHVFFGSLAIDRVSAARRSRRSCVPS